MRPSLRTCEPAIRQIEADCASWQDCGADHACALKQGMCASIADCASGDRCVSNVCRVTCTSDKQCTSLGLLCNLAYAADCRYFRIIGETHGDPGVAWRRPDHLRWHVKYCIAPVPAGDPHNHLSGLYDFARAGTDRLFAAQRAALGR